MLNLQKRNRQNMELRKQLIIISSIIILLLFGATFQAGYKIGEKNGMDNAEELRKQKLTEKQNVERIKISQEANANKIKSVIVAKVQNEQLTTKTASTGRVISINNITISSEVQGTLIGQNKLKKGMEIKKGVTIFSIKNTDLKLLINAKKSRLMSIVSTNLAEIQIDFNSEYEKWNHFFNNISLERNLPEFPKMNSTKEKNFIISRSILAEYLSIKSDEEKLKKYTVVAPFDGIITRSYTDIGANVNPGTPIIDFIRKGEMEIELSVNTSEIHSINIGDNVIFTENDKKYSGKIIRKGNFINTNTQNACVFASITTPDSTLYSGMYLDAIINSKSSKNAFKIARRAVFNENKVYYIDANNKLQEQTINIISYLEDEIIVDNLDDGMLIVNEPVISVKKGEVVKAIIK